MHGFQILLQPRAKLGPLSHVELGVLNVVEDHGTTLDGLFGDFGGGELTEPVGCLRCHLAEAFVTGLGSRVGIHCLQCICTCLIQIIIYLHQPFLRLLLQLHRRQLITASLALIIAFLRLISILGTSRAHLVKDFNRQIFIIFILTSIFAGT